MLLRALHIAMRQINRAFTARSVNGSVGSPAHSFARDDSGAIAIIFAVALIPLLLMVGSAIDYSRAALDRAEAQDAIDAAALAVVKRVALLNDREVDELVESYVRANLPSTINLDIKIVNLSRDPGSLEIRARGSTETTIMKLAHFDKLDYSVYSKAVASEVSIEVALVLDNSGSMGGSRIRGLREASTALVKILEENQHNSEDLSIGIVPFNHLVRVDEGTRDEAVRNWRHSNWLDKDAKSSAHRKNLPPESNRFELFETMRDRYYRQVEWQGCMEARVHPYDVDDTPPSPGKGDTMYLPFFVPDRGEYWSPYKYNRFSYYDYRTYNDVPDYISGHLGWYHNFNYRQYGDYYNQQLRYTYENYSPNFGCTVHPILPLTTNMDTVRSTINEMIADGQTNIHLGTIWGLRLLSNQEPYTEGRPYNDRTNNKYLIIMSDGENVYGENAYRENKYQAYGWASDGRISGSYSTQKEMDKRTLEACQAAKAAEVVVYTIAYGNIGAKTTEMLRTCATLPENAFTPQSTSDMVEVFKRIAAELNTIRLTE